MADQQSLNSLLQWGIENAARSKDSSSQTTDASSTSTAATLPRDPSRGLNAKALAELLGGPSDADRMRDAMAAITAPTTEVPLEQKLVAWENFEQLVEQIDNANNVEALGLWTPLLEQLARGGEADTRRMAAWSVATTVQNNVKAQERLLARGGVALLAARLLDDAEAAPVRKKAVAALSAEVRNFAPALAELERLLPAAVWAPQPPRHVGGVDAGDMEAVDELIQALREYAART